MNIFQKIKRWILTKKFILEEETSFIHSLQPESVKENTRDAETRKRVAKAFEEQKEVMRARAMKPHDASCIDPWTCKKTICFKWEPDKIVTKDDEE
jgi:hypothetical protein